MNIGFGAYDGYRSLGLGEFGMTGDCGQVGELCKDNVNKEDIQELIDRINDHKDCAEKQPHACLFLYPLRKTIDKCIDYIERLSREGNRKAANDLSSAVDEMGQLIGLPKGGYQRLVNAGVDTILDAGLEPWIDDKYRELPWSEISKYMYWSRRNAGTSGGALKYVIAARDSIYFMRNITPADDARRANVIRQLIQGGLQNKNKLGQASSLLNKAWITEPTRKQLRKELSEAYKAAKVPDPDASNMQIFTGAVFSLFAPKGQEDVYMDAGFQAGKDIEEGDPFGSANRQGMGPKQIFDTDAAKCARTGDPAACKRLADKKKGEKCFTFDIKCHYKKNKYPLIATGIAIALLVGYLLTH